MFRFIVLLSLLGTVAAVCNATNCIKGVCYNDLCACASGATSPDPLAVPPVECGIVAGGSCVYANLSKLVTNNFPSLDTGLSKVELDKLVIVVYAPLVNNRSATRLYFGNSSNSFQYPACAFPGPNWVKTIDTVTAGCREVYTSAIPWGTAKLCGWTNATNATTTEYKNSLYVRHDDQVDEFRNSSISRDTINTFPLRISYKTVVDVQTSITVFAPINLLAAVTAQTYDPVTNKGNLRITTSLQWPFFLQSVTVNSVPATVTVGTPSVTNLTCGSTFGNECNQLYSIEISPNALTCTLSGVYVLDFVIACRGNQSQCPLDNNFDNANVSATINSEDFCNGVGIDIGLTGSLAVYQDSGFATPKTSFLHGQTSYFRATLSASPGVTIATSVVEQIRIQTGSNPSTTLRNTDLSPTAAGTSMSITSIGGQPAVNPAFSFIPNQAIMPVAVDQQLSFTVYAVIRVTYNGGVSRRMIIARQVSPSSASDEFAASILMQNPATPTPTPFAQPSDAEPSTPPSPTPIEVSDDSDHASALVASALLLAF